MPPAQSTYAGDVDALFNFILIAGLIIFVIVIATTVFFSMKYRRKGMATKTSGTDHNLGLEILWTAIPTALIVIVFIWTFRSYIKMSVVPGDAIEIKVTAQKWFWTFDYAEGANSVNELVIPVNQPIKLLMSSQDVIHSFFIPNFRAKMDVLPNRYSITWFEATSTGTYDLFCTEYCGKGHSEMLGSVRVVSEEEYKKWIDEGSDPGKGLTLEEFGRKLYVKKACNTCHTTDGSKGVGPTFKGVFGREEIMEDGTPITVEENYIRESILEPKAHIVAGFQPVMPTYQGLLKDREIDAIIAYLKTMKAE